MTVYMSDLKRQSEEELNEWLNGGVLDDNLPVLRGGASNTAAPISRDEDDRLYMRGEWDRTTIALYIVTVIAILILAALAILH